MRSPGGAAAGRARVPLFRERRQRGPAHRLSNVVDAVCDRRGDFTVRDQHGSTGRGRHQVSLEKFRIASDDGAFRVLHVPRGEAATTCNSPDASAYVVGMKKIPKVVLFPSRENRIIASDDQSRRVIVGIGKQRVAFDFFTRITQLPPTTGDRPASVLPIKKNRQ